MKSIHQYITEAEEYIENPATGDIFEVEVAREEMIISAPIVECLEDGIVLGLDAKGWELFESYGYVEEDWRTGVGALALVGSLLGLNAYDTQQMYKSSPQLQQLTSNLDAAMAAGDKTAIENYKQRIKQHKTRLDLGQGEVVGADGEPKKVEIYKESDDYEPNPMTSAVTRRIMNQHPEWIIEYGVKEVMQAIDDVTEGEDDWEEIGSSDVSAYVHRVHKQLKDSYDSRQDTDDRPAVAEAEYRGRKVKLNKPMRGDVKKSKVYVKDPKTGNIKKVNFGDPNMRIKKNIPGRRKNFRARHNCDNPGPKTKARYWSCRAW